MGTRILEPSREPLAYDEDRHVWEGASWGIFAAPGRVIFIECWHNSRRQMIGIDPSHVDEFARQLHAAKRVARKPSRP